MPIIKGIFRKNSQGQWVEYNKTFFSFSDEKDNSDISIITLEGLKKLKTDSLKGFCHSKFKANLVIENLDTNKILPSTQLTIGQAVIEINNKFKKCYKECPVFLQKDNCIIKKHIFFAKVLKSGNIAYNDKVRI